MTSSIDSILVVTLFTAAATYVFEPYVKNAPIEWYRERVLFSLKIGVTLLSVLLASIAFISSNPSIKNAEGIGPFYLVTTILLIISFIFGYIEIRRPQEGNLKVARICSSICIAFVNVSLVYIAALVLCFVGYCFYGI